MKLWESSTKRLFDPRIDEDLKTIFSLVIQQWPFEEWEFQISRMGAYRTEDMQKVCVQNGASKIMRSKHCEGKAIDITLFRAGTEKAIWDRYSYCVVRGFIRYIEKKTGTILRWGADWNDNGVIGEEDNWEVDFVHYEI